jgi:hypothetical protein
MSDKEAGTTIWVPITDLHVDPTVQRPLNRHRVNQIKQEFDPDAVGVLHISERHNGNGQPRYVVIDGQHRRAAILEMGWTDQRVECKPWHDLTVPQEAKLFVLLNNTAKPRRIDRFQKRVVAEDPDAVTIDKIVRSHGFRISDQHGPRLIASTEALEGIYRGDLRTRTGPHPEALDATLRVMTKAWGQDQAIDGRVLYGLGLVMVRHVGEVDEAALARKLAGFPGGPANLLGKARGLRELQGGTVVKCLAATIIELYNRGRRTNLLADWWSKGRR